jgi:copper(I)-binding protein
MITLFAFLTLLFPIDDNIKIIDPWMRPNAKGMASALYFTIENEGETADTLFKVESDLAERIEIHETYSSGDVMGMREVGMIVVEARSSFELKPGAHHIMLMKLKQDLKSDEKGDFTLHFKEAGEIKITAVVKSK